MAWEMGSPQGQYSMGTAPSLLGYQSNMIWQNPPLILNQYIAPTIQAQSFQGQFSLAYQEYSVPSTELQNFQHFDQMQRPTSSQENYVCARQHQTWGQPKSDNGVHRHQQGNTGRAWRSAKKTRNGQRGSLFCNFCKSNGETGEYVTSHNTKDQNGIITCPVLRKFVCSDCGGTGDYAHTAKYCPLNPINKSIERCRGDGNKDNNDNENGGRGFETAYPYQTKRNAAGGYSVTKY